MTQGNVVLDIDIQKPRFYCIGNEKLPEGKTLIKEIDPPVNRGGIPNRDYYYEDLISVSLHAAMDLLD